MTTVYILKYYDLHEQGVVAAHTDIQFCIDKAIEFSKEDTEYTYKVETWVDGLFITDEKYYWDGTECEE